MKDRTTPPAPPEYPRWFGMATHEEAIQERRTDFYDQWLEAPLESIAERFESSGTVIGPFLVRDAIILGINVPSSSLSFVYSVYAGNTDRYGFEAAYLIITLEGQKQGRSFRTTVSYGVEEDHDAYDIAEEEFEFLYKKATGLPMPDDVSQPPRRPSQKTEHQRPPLSRPVIRKREH